jgi:hypothetical protein
LAFSPFCTTLLLSAMLLIFVELLKKGFCTS